VCVPEPRPHTRRHALAASLLLLTAGGVLADSSSGKKSVEDGDSHYLAAIWKKGAAVERMTPRLLTPKAAEAFAPPRENCEAITSADGYKSAILPYVESVGPVALQPHAADSEFAKKITRSLDAAWAAVTKKANSEPVDGSILRVLTKHYPRPDLPGSCFTLHVTFFTVRDPFFDGGEDMASLLRRMHGKTVPGTMYELRKTYRMKDGERRLIEAQIEASPNVTVRMQRRGFAEVSKRPEAKRFLDAFHGAHFQLYGGGSRHGFVWYDQSLGEGNVRAYSAAYIIERETDGPAKIETGDVAPAMLEAVLTIIKRS